MSLKKKNSAQRTKEWIERGRYYGHDATTHGRKSFKGKLSHDQGLGNNNNNTVTDETLCDERDPMDDQVGTPPEEQFYRLVARMACPPGPLFEDFYNHFVMILNSYILLRQHEGLSYTSNAFMRGSLQPAFDHVCSKWEPRIAHITSKPFSETCPAFHVSCRDFNDMVRKTIQIQLAQQATPTRTKESLTSVNPVFHCATEDIH